MKINKIIKPLFMALAICLIATQADTLDYPHSYINNLDCDACHFIYGTEAPYLPKWTNQPAQNIDDTPFNKLCWNCHDDDVAPYMRTHSSLEIDNSYGDWTVECRTCHNPHMQKQVAKSSYRPEAYLASGASTGLTETTLTLAGANWTTNAYKGLVLIPYVTKVTKRPYGYKITGNTIDTITVDGPIDLTKASVGNTFAVIYGKLIQNEIVLDDIIGVSKTGDKEVRLFDSMGANSYADADSTYDGVCEVCHTETLYHRNESFGPAHNLGTKCTVCHQHIEGFKGTGCDTCHGYPPVLDSAIGGPDGLVDDPGITGSLTAGAHDMHVNTKQLPCQVCHYNSAGSGPTHNDGSLDITMGFSLFNDTYLGGIYDGQTEADYDSSEANTTVLKTGAKSCSLLYCHSNAAPFDGINEYKTPLWDGSTTCASCHDEGGSSSLLSGKHPMHTDGSRHGIECEKCHFQTADGSSAIKTQSYHVNNVKDIIFSAGGSLDTGTKACTNTYCHSDAVGGPPNTSVEWDSGFSMECYSCHNGTQDDDNSTNCAAIGGTWEEVYEGSWSCTFADQTTCENNSGVWDVDKGCYTKLTMRTDAHDILASKKWIREYKCYTCHDDTTDESNNIDGFSSHVNEVKDITFRDKWYLFAPSPTPTYDSDTKVCGNIYCHSDGTTVNPEVRPYPWDALPKGCSACHGHSGDCSECHEDITGWAVGEEWMSAMPMYSNEGPGLPKSNTHSRHVLTDFTCDECHGNTVIAGACTTTDCHDDGIPSGSMYEYGHVDADYHVNKVKDVYFTGGGTYDPMPNAKTCSNTECHTGADPQWGDSVNSEVLCYECHGTSSGDVDDFTAFNGTQAKIDVNEWADTGHGRPAASGDYPYSNNPPADFPGNPCWYCHDNEVLHDDYTNPLRLQMHDQYEKRFEKECVYCHMQGLVSECLTCHNTITPTFAPQLDDVNAPPFSVEHNTWNISGDIGGESSCLDDDVSCHGGSPPDPHNVNAGLWEDYEINDVKNQYMMMGVCLKCHDDDSNGKCHDCHEAPPEDPGRYSPGFDPGTGLVTATSKATSTHFGYKHYAAYETSFGVQADSGVFESGSIIKVVDTDKSWTTDQWAGDYVMVTSGDNNGEYRRILSNTGDTLTMAESFTNAFQAGDSYYLNDPVWKGGKFCWDCHDPHGDSNIYMIQDEIATETDGVFGLPVSKRAVTFTQKSTGLDYVRTSGPDYDGICNVCHTDPDMHYRFDYGDGHQSGRICTTCHEHRFSDSHASGQSCSECHGSKPIPRHTGFGLPKDCTKCHAGIINKRVDIVTQLSATNSHHIQGVEVTNKHCYACHWESTEDGLINVDHHQGYNFLTHDTTKNAAADLVIWGDSERPTTYEDGVTATSFLATNIGTVDERTEVAKVTLHCLSCHSEQNNDTQPFNVVDPLNGDCKTPNQYAWDGTSIGERYSQMGTTTWGKYETVTGAAQKNITKAFSAHGNAVNNEGGWNDVTGLDGAIPNTRAGGENVQCFDCHSSHGSRTEGITSSYATFNGTFNGANLKETQAGKEGYQYTYRASSNMDADAINPYNAGAGQCFDCHQTENAKTLLYAGNYSPWGYNDTFGADAGIGIVGYKDTPYFGQIVKDDGTSNNGDTTTINDTDKSWTTDQWVDYIVLMKSGDNDGEMRMILSNTSTALTIDAFYAFENPVMADDYEIIQPKAATARFAYKASRAALMGGHLRASRPVKDFGTATDGSVTTVEDSGKSWSVDQWAGYFVLMKSGDNDGEMRRISSNTSTELTVYTFDNAVLLDDDYEIVQPMVKETGTATGGDTITLDDSGKNWADNEWAGNYLLMMSGNNSGRLRSITSNTQTQLVVGEYANNIASGDSYEIVPYTKTINGLCTPCHDPHGVSPTLGDDQRYAVPLLKGTWLTSPYKEDHPPVDPTGNCADRAEDENNHGFNTAWGDGANCRPPDASITAGTHYYLDRNTFNTDRISEDDGKFAGLCLRCHPKENLTDGSDKNTEFRTKDRIHESVKGWGENTEHSWPCSKCHQPHVSGLPRLMQTNCLDYNHRGYRVSGGIPWTSNRQDSRAWGKSESQGYPIATIYNNSSSYRAQNSCHTEATPNPDVWPDSNRWNNVTPW